MSSHGRIDTFMHVGNWAHYINMTQTPSAIMHQPTSGQLQLFLAQFVQLFYLFPDISYTFVQV